MAGRTVSILRDLFTGANGVTHDLGRYSWAGSFAAVIGAGIWNAWHGAAIDIMQAATALGAVAAAHGGALWAKASTEPKP